MKAVVRTTIMFTIVLASCGKPSAEEYMKKAEEAEKGGLWSLALENYQNIVKDHPGSVSAEIAAFNIAAIQHNSLQNFQVAVDAYKLFLEQYLDARKAPTAMFLVGFLYHNELKNLDSAKVFYQRFLAKYPDNEMAISAQFELQNLGKSPDEILAKPAVAETSTPKSEVKASSKLKNN